MKPIWGAMSFGRGKRWSAVGILVYLGVAFWVGFDIMGLMPYLTPLVAYLFGADVYQHINGGNKDG